MVAATVKTGLLTSVDIIHINSLFAHPEAHLPGDARFNQIDISTEHFTQYFPLCFWETDYTSR